MNNLQLDRPLVCFDLETTGIDVMRDRIVQIALIRVEPDGSRRSFESLVNPECPIPPGATRVHGITDADVADKPTLARLCAELETMLDGADLAGFNSIRFDLPLLENELQRVGGSFDAGGRRHLDALRIFHRLERRDLTAAYKFYCGKDLVGAHSALVDTEATLEILDAQIAHYDEVPADTEALHRFCNPDANKYVDRTRKFVWNDAGEAVFTFGKLRDRTLRDVVTEASGRSYLEWMIGKDFSDEVKDILRGALNGVFPRRS